MLCSTRLVLLAATVFAVAAAIAAPASNAAAWRTYTEHPGSNNDNPSLVRTPDGVLHIAYVDHLASLDNNFRYRTLAPNGVTFSAPNSIVEHWVSLAEGALVTVGGTPTVIWGGQRTSDVADPAASGQAWAASLTGGAWTLSATPVSTSNTPYASSQVSAAVDNTGVPWFSWSTTFGVGIHQSLSPLGFEDTNAGPATCCGYGSNLAKDAVTGDTYLVYQSNATDGSGYW
ncbi:MAG: hypothetical protein H7287_09505, partial [Thermoleophilia bacterium]|nr:hypothetical protein [Thermoleophilia bacterium]